MRIEAEEQEEEEEEEEQQQQQEQEEQEHEQEEQEEQAGGGGGGGGVERGVDGVDGCNHRSAAGLFLRACVLRQYPQRVESFLQHRTF